MAPRVLLVNQAAPAHEACKVNRVLSANLESEALLGPLVRLDHLDRRATEDHLVQLANADLLDRR